MAQLYVVGHQKSLESYGSICRNSHGLQPVSFLELENELEDVMSPIPSPFSFHSATM